MHSEYIVCTRCRGFEYCKDCLSTVFRFTKDIESTSVMNLYSVTIVLYDGWMRNSRMSTKSSLSQGRASTIQ